MSPERTGKVSRSSLPGPAPPPRFLRMEVWAGVRPTEDGERIRAALEELFPGLTWTDDNDSVVGVGEDATGFRAGVKVAVIADTVASHLETVGPGVPEDGVGGGEEGAGGEEKGGGEEGAGGEEKGGGEAAAEVQASGDDEGPWTATVHLNKQAAMVGRLHLGDCKTALGDVEVTLEFAARPCRESLVKWFVDAPDVPGSGGVS